MPSFLSAGIDIAYEVYGEGRPILLIHGLDDKNTPPLHSQVIASRRPNIDLWLVPGAGHTGAFQAAPGEFRYRVLSWLSNHSLPGPLAALIEENRIAVTTKSSRSPEARYRLRARKKR